MESAPKIETWTQMWQGDWSPAIEGIGNEWNPSPMDTDVHDGTNLSFHLSGMMADRRRNLGQVGKIEILPILQICPRSSQMIGDIYDFEFSLVKIWDGEETVQSQTVWDFPDTWTPGLNVIDVIDH